MPVTTSAADALNVTRPALVAPAGAIRWTFRVTPGGMPESIATVIFCPDWLVVMSYVVLESDAVSGLDPDVAVDTVNAPGLPLTTISLMAFTEKVIVWVALLPANSG